MQAAAEMEIILLLWRRRAVVFWSSSSSENAKYRISAGAECIAQRTFEFRPLSGLVHTESGPRQRCPFALLLLVIPKGERRCTYCWMRLKMSPNAR